MEVKVKHIRNAIPYIGMIVLYLMMDLLTDDWVNKPTGLDVFIVLGFALSSIISIIQLATYLLNNFKEDTVLFRIKNPFTKSKERVKLMEKFVALNHRIARNSAEGKDEQVLDLLDAERVEILNQLKNLK